MTTLQGGEQQAIRTVWVSKHGSCSGRTVIENVLRSEIQIYPRSLRRGRASTAPAPSCSPPHLNSFPFRPRWTCERCQPGENRWDGPATINKCVVNREQEFICCISIFSKSLSLKFVHIQCLWVLWLTCWTVYWTTNRCHVLVCVFWCVYSTYSECVSVFAVLLWAAVVERSGWHFKVVRQQLCHDKNIVSEPEEARKQQHCSRMLS